jgi:hypothetical protein
MAFDLGIDSTGRPGAQRRFRPAADHDGDIPLSPPPCVLAEVDAAFERAEKLRAAGREMHFGIDTVTHRLVIEIRTLRGEVLETLAPSAALDFIAGELS